MGNSSIGAGKAGRVELARTEGRGRPRHGSEVRRLAFVHVIGELADHRPVGAEQDGVDQCRRAGQGGPGRGHQRLRIPVRLVAEAEDLVARGRQAVRLQGVVAVRHLARRAALRRPVRRERLAGERVLQLGGLVVLPPPPHDADPGQLSAQVGADAVVVAHREYPAARFHERRDRGDLRVLRVIPDGRILRGAERLLVLALIGDNPQDVVLTEIGCYLVLLRVGLAEDEVSLVGQPHGAVLIASGALRAEGVATPVRGVHLDGRRGALPQCVQQKGHAEIVGVGRCLLWTEVQPAPIEYHQHPDICHLVPPSPTRPRKRASR